MPQVPQKKKRKRKKHELAALQNRGYNIPDTDTVDDNGEVDSVGDEVVTTEVVSEEMEVDVPGVDALEDPREVVVGAEEGAEEEGEGEEEEGDPLVVGEDSVETEDGPTVEEEDASCSV